MSFWYLDNLERFKAERSAMAALAASAEWIGNIQWQLQDSSMLITAVIHAHGHDYPISLTYPEYFPASPPIVRPINADRRWSSHQYGDVNGPLCLEWGPDNWDPSITGSQMIESAYRLLDCENPLGDEQELSTEVPSRHELTFGQQLRGCVS